MQYRTSLASEFRACLIPNFSSSCLSSSSFVVLSFPEGIQGMLRGALLYGGIIYISSGSKRNGQLQDYTEEPAAISTF